MARRPHLPIDARQYVWWHRLRRWGRWGFALGGGALAAPLLTCVLFAGVILYYDYPASTYFSVATRIWLVSAPIYVAACLWTWSHMEGRYRATLDLRCPQCGYPARGRADDALCPECGTERGVAETSGTVSR